MTLEKYGGLFTICKIKKLSDFNLNGYFFIGKTDDEISLVCEAEHTPTGALQIDKGWRALRVSGELEFALVGILSKISSVLAESGIPIFAVSTYNTDYILIKDNYHSKAIGALVAAGYTIK